VQQLPTVTRWANHIGSICRECTRLHDLSRLHPQTFCARLI